MKTNFEDLHKIFEELHKFFLKIFNIKTIFEDLHKNFEELHEFLKTFKLDDNTFLKAFNKKFWFV